jgi:Mor family transcriptional regulator
VRNYRLSEQSITTELCNGVTSIFREDELILEAQQLAMEANQGRTFYNLNIDAGAMWVRHLIDEMISAEWKRGQGLA